MLSMDSTSRKEHHIINVLGWCGREEKCRMSPPDREKTLRLFISGHLPQTAFSPFAFDTLQKAQRMENAAGWREQHPQCPCSPSRPSHPFLTSHKCHLHHPSVPFGPFVTRNQQGSITATKLRGPTKGPSAMPYSSHCATNGRTYLATQDQSLKDVWMLSVIAGYQIPSSRAARASLPQGQPLGATLPSIPWPQPLPYL